MSLNEIRVINHLLRSWGFVVHEWLGWESRSNGQISDFVGGIVHHTATAYGSAPAILVNGRSDLPGPLCNYAGNADGSLTVIAAGPANHAGRSGGYSMGPLPVTAGFNRYVLGLEIVYPGTEPMRPEQYAAAVAWGRAVADIVGWGDSQRIRAHAETSVTGKWDPGYAPGRTIDMNMFRAAVAQFTPGPAPVKPTTQDEEPMSIHLYPATDITKPGRAVMALPAPAKDETPGSPGSKLRLSTGWGQEFNLKVWFLATGLQRYLNAGGGNGATLKLLSDNPGVVPVPDGTVAIHAEWTSKLPDVPGEITVKFVPL